MCRWSSGLFSHLSVGGKWNYDGQQSSHVNKHKLLRLLETTDQHALLETFSLFSFNCLAPKQLQLLFDKQACSSCPLLGPVAPQRLFSTCIGQVKRIVKPLMAHCIPLCLSPSEADWLPIVHCPTHHDAFHTPLLKQLSNAFTYPKTSRSFHSHCPDTLVSSCQSQETCRHISGVLKILIHHAAVVSYPAKHTREHAPWLWQITSLELLHILTQILDTSWGSANWNTDFESNLFCRVIKMTEEFFSLGRDSLHGTLMGLFSVSRWGQGRVVGHPLRRLDCTCGLKHCCQLFAS